MAVFHFFHTLAACMAGGDIQSPSYVHIKRKCQILQPMQHS